MSYGGGGFMNSGGGSQGSPGTKSKSTALRPVTIHQILQAEQPHPESEFLIDAIETKDVSFVACVRSIQRGSTNHSFVVEDGTGQIDARKWTEQGSEVQDGIEQDLYVRVVGSIKTFANKRHIVATSIRLLEDKNELLFHIAEAVHVHLSATRGPPGGATVAQGVHTGANPYAAAADMGAGETLYGDLRGLQRKIMDYVGNLSNLDQLPQEGVHLQHIAREIGSDIDTVRHEVESLGQDGHLYSAIDDDHVLPTA